MNEEIKTPEKIHIAMLNIMRSVKPIIKGKQGYNYKFRGIEDAYDALHDLLADNGVYMTSEVIIVGDKDIIRWWYIAEDGSHTFSDIQNLTEKQFENLIKIILEKNGYDVSKLRFEMTFQYVGMGISYSQKYALFSTFLIPTSQTKDLDEEQTKKFAKEKREITMVDPKPKISKEEQEIKLKEFIGTFAGTAEEIDYVFNAILKEANKIKLDLDGWKSTKGSKKAIENFISLSIDTYHSERNKQ